MKKPRTKTHWGVWVALAIMIAGHAIVDIEKKNMAHQFVEQSQTRNEEKNHARSAEPTEVPDLLSNER